MQDMPVASLPRHRRPFRPAWAAGLIQGRAPRGVSIRDETTSGPTGAPLRLRIYTPSGASPAAGRPLAVNIHGGGWVLGNPEMTEWLCGQVAEGCAALVVSVDYRLAPEHPAPAAYQDCWHAVRHLLANHVGYQVDPQRWCAFGDSAGGNLSALLAIGWRDAVRSARARGDEAELASLGTMRAQGLVYPVTDLTFASDSYRRHATAPVLTRAAMIAFREHYLGRSGIAPGDPRVSPAFCADLAGLPPAIVTVAGRDPLADEAVEYAARLAAAGVQVELDRHPGVPHGFTTMRGVSSAAAPAGQRIVAFLRRQLTASLP